MEFVCSKCNHVDLIVLVYPDCQLPSQIDQQLCFKCKNGHPHDVFETKPYDPEKDDCVNRRSGIGLG